MKNLFILGAQRSGSTYLYHVLNNHPQVLMNLQVRPEPKFFLNEKRFSLGKEYYEEKYFHGCRNKILYLGEKSTSYFESYKGAKRIKEFYPDAKIIIILRDPVLRAYSNYKFSVSNKLEKLSFSEALAKEPDRIGYTNFATSVNPYAYRARGFYMNYIENWLSIFERKQFCILIFEEFTNSIKSVQRLYRWLEIDECFVPSDLKTVFNSTIKEPVDLNQSFSDLALGYLKSVNKLENFLGRRIDHWNKNHRMLLSTDLT